MRLGKTITACAVAGAIALGAQTTASASELNPNSVVDHLKSVGQDSSFASRVSLAANYGIAGYTGTEDQNVQLLYILRGAQPMPVQEPKSEPVVESQPVQQQAQVQEQPKPQEDSAPQGKTITVVATAYTADPSENGTYNGRVLTATGMDLTANPNARIIAVDPNVIPLGTKVYVEGYGYATAEDTGGAIKNMRIDVLVPSHEEARQWGRRTVTVKILD